MRSAFALCVLLSAACRAGAPPAGHPLLGTWELVLPGSKCVETCDYRADGTLHTVSAAEETDTDCQVAATLSAQGYRELTVTIRKTNGKPDCCGRLTPLGKPFTLCIWRRCAAGFSCASIRRCSAASARSRVCAQRRRPDGRRLSAHDVRGGSQAVAARALGAIERGVGFGD